MTHFDDQDAVCPFFQNTGEVNKYSWITCEGLIAGTTIRQQFKSRKKRDDYKCSYCDSFNYEKCPLQEALSEKYE